MNGWRWYYKRRPFSVEEKKKSYPQSVQRRPLSKKSYYTNLSRKFKSIHQTDARLRFLSRCTEIELNNPQPYWTRRSAVHRAHRGSRCQCCRASDAICYHHIILLKNGGADVKRNRILICQECHEKIHPWMKAMREGAEMDKEFVAVVGKI